MGNPNLYHFNTSKFGKIKIKMAGLFPLKVYPVILMTDMMSKCHGEMANCELPDKTGLFETVWFLVFHVYSVWFCSSIMDQ